MQSVRLPLLLCALLSALAVQCAPSPSSQPAEGRTGAASSGPKRVVAAIRGNPAFVSSALNSGGGGRIDGNVELGGLVTTGFAVQKPTGDWVPMLVEHLPSLDNGSWAVLPDGSMETSYTIRAGATWHDGTAFTSRDVEFTLQAGRDPGMPWIIDPAYRYIDSVQVIDDRNVKIVWRETYIRANELPLNPVFPRHILEQPYLNEPESIGTLPYWTTDFIATGPFKVKDFVRDSHVELVAYDGYVLGRPKIDELEVRFIADDNALAASLLAGAVDMTIGPGMSLEQGIQIRDRWTDGAMQTGPNNAINMNTQFVNPDPPILANVQFRKALMMAIDRKRLADEFMYGLSDVADSSINPAEPEFKYVEPSIVKYAFEPTRSAQMIESLGFQKGGDGMFQDNSGKPLVVQIMSTQDDANAKPQIAILDGWKTIGITPDAELVTPQRQRDLAYRANFHAYSLQSGISSGADGVSALLSREARVPERNYLGRNYTRYMNPDTDALVDRYFTTIPFDSRMQVLSQIIHLTTDELIWNPMYWRVLPTLVHHRIVNVDALGFGDQWWNAHLWDVKS